MATQFDIPTGQLQPEDVWGEYNQMAFVIQQFINRVQTATIVRVDAVTNEGGVSPVGFVDITPQVNQLDNNGLPEPHVSIFNVPYARLQGGGDAVILDPKEGDLGIALFASRDITKVKSTKAAANPGSARKYDFADALYIGGLLNGTPTQYIRFSTAGIVVHSPTKIICEAPEIEHNGGTVVNVTAPDIRIGAEGQELLTLVTAAFVELFNTHDHAGAGAPPTQQMGNGELTSILTAG